MLKGIAEVKRGLTWNRRFVIVNPGSQSLYYKKSESVVEIRRAYDIIDAKIEYQPPSTSNTLKISFLTPEKETILLRFSTHLETTKWYNFIKASIRVTPPIPDQNYELLEKAYKQIASEKVTYTKGQQKFILNCKRYHERIIQYFLRPLELVKSGKRKTIFKPKIQTSQDVLQVLFWGLFFVLTFILILLGLLFRGHVEEERLSIGVMNILVWPIIVIIFTIPCSNIIGTNYFWKKPPEINNLKTSISVLIYAFIGSVFTKDILLIGGILLSYIIIIYTVKMCPLSNPIISGISWGSLFIVLGVSLGNPFFSGLCVSILMSTIQILNLLYLFTILKSLNFWKRIGISFGIRSTLLEGQRDFNSSWMKKSDGLQYQKEALKLEIITKGYSHLQIIFWLMAGFLLPTFYVGVLGFGYGFSGTHSLIIGGFWGVVAGIGAIAYSIFTWNYLFQS